MARALALVLGILILAAGVAYLLAANSIPSPSPPPPEVAASSQEPPPLKPAIDLESIAPESTVPPPGDAAASSPTAADPTPRTDSLNQAEAAAPTIAMPHPDGGGADRASVSSRQQVTNPGRVSEERGNRTDRFPDGTSSRGGGSAGAGSSSSATGSQGAHSTGSPSAATAGPMIPAGAAGAAPVETESSAGPPGPASTATSDQPARVGDESAEATAESDRSRPDDPGRDREDRSPAERPEQSPDTGPARVWLSPSAAEIAVGTLLEIQVWLEDGGSVSSVPFHLLVDPVVLAYRGASEGPLLRGDGSNTVFMTAPSVSGERVVVGLSRLGQVSGIAGGGLLCSVTFEAIAPGQSAILFDRALVVGADGNPESAVFDGGLVQVTP